MHYIWLLCLCCHYSNIYSSYNEMLNVLKQNVTFYVYVKIKKFMLTCACSSFSTILNLWCDSKTGEREHLNV